MNYRKVLIKNKIYHSMDMLMEKKKLNQVAFKL